MSHGTYGFDLRTEYQGNKHHRHKCFVCVFVERGTFYTFNWYMVAVSKRIGF